MLTLIALWCGEPNAARDSHNYAQVRRCRKALIACAEKRQYMQVNKIARECFIEVMK
jgi:hypothetical protein